MTTRLPRGYRGVRHETIGSDLLAILKVTKTPEYTLGPELAAKLAAVKMDGWYPISLMLETLEALDARLGSFGLRNVGWELFRLSHADAFRKNVHSARQFVHGFDAIYRAANRGTDIGGWQVLSFTGDSAELEKTTPHHCGMEEGIVQEALKTLGVLALVSQSQCFRKGAESCRFTIHSQTRDTRWTGK